MPIQKKGKKTETKFKDLITCLLVAARRAHNFYVSTKALAKPSLRCCTLIRSFGGKFLCFVINLVFCIKYMPSMSNKVIAVAVFKLGFYWSNSSGKWKYKLAGMLGNLVTRRRNIVAIGVGSARYHKSVFRTFCNK